MNPIMSLLQRTPQANQQKANSIEDILMGVRKGTFDARSEVMQAVSKMNPQQKAQLQQHIPLLQRYIGNTPALQEFMSCLK